MVAFAFALAFAFFAACALAFARAARRRNILVQRFAAHRARHIPERLERERPPRGVLSLFARGRGAQLGLDALLHATRNTSSKHTLSFPAMCFPLLVRIGDAGGGSRRQEGVAHAKRDVPHGGVPRSAHAAILLRRPRRRRDLR